MKNHASRFVLTVACWLTAAPVLAISNEEFSHAVEQHLNAIQSDAALSQGMQQLCTNLRGQRFDDDARCVALDRLVMEREERERPHPYYALLLTCALIFLLAAIPAVITLRRNSEIVEKQSDEK